MPEARTFNADLDGRRVWPVALYHFDIQGDPVNIHNDVGTIAYNSRSYIGFGDMISDNGINEDGSLNPDSLTFTLSIWTQELIDAARNSTYIDRPVEKHLALRNLATGALVDHALVYRGLMGPITADQDAGVINMSAQDERELFERPIGRAFADAEHQRQNPGDTFFQHLLAMKDIKVRVGIL